MTDESSESSRPPFARFRRILPRLPSQVGTSATAQTLEIQAETTRRKASVARPPPTTSSERGKAFRARRRVYKGQLQDYLKVLQEEIWRLEERKDLLRGRQLQRRESATGSLVRLVREYYTIFQFGMGDRQRAMADPLYARQNAAEVAYKENFLRTVMVEDAPTGDLVGPDSSLMQWHFFSAAHSKLIVHIDEVEVIGDPNDPFIDLHSTMHVVCGPQTLAVLFPGAEQNHNLVRKFDKLHVAFPLLTRFKFATDGRICYEHVSSNLLEGYLRAGVSLDDIVKLFKFMIVSPSLTVKEDVAKSTADRAIYRRTSIDVEIDDRRPAEYSHVTSDLDSHAQHHRHTRSTPQHNRHWFICDANQ